MRASQQSPTQRGSDTLNNMTNFGTNEIFHTSEIFVMKQRTSL